MKEIITWTDDRDDFIQLLKTDVEYYITNSNKLVVGGEDVVGDMHWWQTAQSDIVEALWIGGFPLVWLKSFMAEHYPEIDVDTQFEIEQKGVFQGFREWNEDAYFQFQDWQNKECFKELVRKLADRGYELSFVASQ